MIICIIHYIPVYAAHFSEPVSQVSDECIDGHIHPKHFTLSTGAPVDHCDIDRSTLTLWEGQGDTDVGVKGT